MHPYFCACVCCVFVLCVCVCLCLCVCVSLCLCLEAYLRASQRSPSRKAVRIFSRCPLIALSNRCLNEFHFASRLALADWCRRARGLHGALRADTLAAMPAHLTRAERERGLAQHLVDPCLRLHGHPLRELRRSAEQEKKGGGSRAEWDTRLPPCSPAPSPGRPAAPRPPSCARVGPPSSAAVMRAAARAEEIRARFQHVCAKIHEPAIRNE